MWKPIILDVECIVCNKSLQKINHGPPEVTRKMGKITCRRSRTPNWSADEKKYLLELIKERKDVVVTKNNNGPNYSEEKDIAWNEILRELSVKFGNKFSGSSTKKVKTQWQNMKRIAREEIALVGPDVSKFTRQTLEVCNILDMIKDGVLKRDVENLNDTVMTTNIEIKTERIDEDVIEPCSSGIHVAKEPPTINQCQANPATVVRAPPSESSSGSDEESRPLTIDLDESTSKNASVMTEPCGEAAGSVGPFQRQLQEFFRYSSEERQLKMESLKEEHRVVKVMRETAELNKIIAEQKLKHVLWVKKQEMTMYSGRPGSDAGKGGGDGAIREAGGAFGKMEAAREDQYFYNKQKEQLAALKSHLDKEIQFHQDQIKRHEDAIRRHKEQMTNMDSK